MVWTVYNVTDEVVHYTICLERGLGKPQRTMRLHQPNSGPSAPWRPGREPALRYYAVLAAADDDMPLLLGRSDVYYPITQGPPHRGDLAVNLLLGTTLFWLPLTIAAVGRGAFVKYRFTDRRISVITNAPWKSEWAWDEHLVVASRKKQCNMHVAFHMACACGVKDARVPHQRHHQRALG